MSQTLFLKNLKDAALSTAEIPLFGSPPSFPYEEFAKSLSSQFEIKIEISQQKTDWLEPTSLLEGMGKSPIITPFSLSPLPGPFFWILPQEGQAQIFTHLLKQQGKGFSDPILREGFLTYVFLEVLHCLNTLNPYGNLTAMLHEEIPLPQESALGIDLSIQLEGTSLWGRLLIPNTSRESFKTHFTMETPPLLSDPSFASLSLSFHLQVGSTILLPEEWDKVHQGDFILLERCTYDIKRKQGTAILTLGETPLFDVRIKDGECKILEYAFIQEDRSMTEEEQNETAPSQKNEEEEKPLWAAQNGEQENILPSKKIPIQLIAEIGRIQMPLEKVTQLSAGNVLEMGISPQPVVYLTVGGKRIAKGELVNLGETLGVKILKLGE